MYTEHYGLHEVPFSGSLDPFWFYESPGHEEAVARLMYLLEQRRRCGVLLGPAGSGKSLVLRVLAAEARRLTWETVLIDLIGRTGREMLWETLAALGLAPPKDDSPRVLWRILGDHLATSRFVQAPMLVCFDHLDRAEPDCLPALERLYHAGAADEGGVTILTSARSGRLSRLTQTLPQIADLHIELSPLTRSQTEAYIDTRLARAGATQVIFESEAYDRIHSHSRGIPRDINRLCDLALVAGMADGVTRITDAIVTAAAEQLHPLRHTAPNFHTRRRVSAELS